jgi:hypothetical protein
VADLDTQPDVTRLQALQQVGGALLGFCGCSMSTDLPDAHHLPKILLQQVGVAQQAAMSANPSMHYLPLEGL